LPLEIDPIIQSASAGPIGYQQLPPSRDLVNALELNIKSAHFWGMDDEWFLTAGGPSNIPHSNAPIVRCFSRIRRDLVC
jgi:hypothetical protein